MTSDGSPPSPPFKLPPFKLPPTRWLAPQPVADLEDFVNYCSGDPARALRFLASNLISQYDGLMDGWAVKEAAKEQAWVAKEQAWVAKEAAKEQAWVAKEQTWVQTWAAKEQAWVAKEQTWAAKQETWAAKQETWVVKEKSMLEWLQQKQQVVKAKDAAVKSLRRALQRLARRLPSNNHEAGATTRLALWKKWEPRVAKHRPLPSPRPEHAVAADDKAVTGVLGRTYPKEKKMYAPMVKMLESVLAAHGRDDVAVVDTSQNGYLEGTKPDITLTLNNFKGVHPPYVGTIFELKRPGTKLGPAAYGHVLDYIPRLMRAQPHRTRFSALLSNLHQNIWFQIEARPELRVSMSVPVDLKDALSHLLRVLDDPSEAPLWPRFSADLGTFQNHLGASNKSVVAEFNLPSHRADGNLVWVHDPDQILDAAAAHHGGSASVDAPPPVVAVKRSIDLRQQPDLKHEIRILHSFDRSGSCASLPSLLFHDRAETEIGYLPVGEPVDFDTLGCDQKLATDVLSDVHSALAWLHAHHLVHRDVRWANVILYGSRGVLIDMGCATEIGVPDQVYSGGFVCCPRELLGLDLAETTYTPQAAHDWAAYILLVNALLFPHVFRDFISANLEQPDSDETWRLSQLWDRLKASPIWGSYVAAAAATSADPNGVAKLKEMPGDFLISLDMAGLRHLSDLEIDFLMLDGSTKDWEMSVELIEGMLPEDEDVGTTDLETGLQKIDLAAAKDNDNDDDNEDDETEDDESNDGDDDEA